MQFIPRLKFSFFFLGLCICGCTSHKERSVEPVYAYIDTTAIYRSEIDKLISQELYDELCRIYLIRQTALEGVIKERLLQREAEAQHISVEALLDRFYQELVKNKLRLYGSKYAQYIREWRQDRPIFVSAQDSLRFYNIVKAEAKDALCTQLSDKYQIKINLQPPVSPQLDLQYAIVHYRGNVSSPVTCLEISDFDCSNCRAYHPVLDSLYRKYKDRVRFAFTHYGSYPSLSARACESAARQDKFWEMYEALMKTPRILTQPEEVEAVASTLDLNMAEFKAGLRDSTLSQSILQNMESLEKSGVYGTPTIAVNNRILFNASSFEDIDRLIQEQLESSGK